MCGISGLIQQSTLTTADKIKAQSLNHCLEHRGPDSDGWYEADNFMLAMRRLSIIDVAGGTQPLYNEDKSVVLLFNGEIYNFVELRQQLEQRGHVFATHSDGETVCHLYEERGIKCIEQLRGMFAISLYDKKQNKIYLIRDRMSEKPVYYIQQADQILYASEFKAIAKVVDTTKLTLNPRAMDLFLHYQFIPEPMTMLQEVHKLPAAHYLEVDLITLKTTITQYWNMLDAKPVVTDDPVKLVRDELLYIGEIIGRSDVPVGIALSGGLDSSAVAALVKHHNANKDITHAFTVGYEGRPVYDERTKAKALSDSLGIELHEVELSTKDFLDHFPKLVYEMDDPVGDIAAYSIYSVMKIAHEQGIKVMLNGIGADELFWGYQWIIDAVTLSEASKTFTFYNQNADWQFSAHKTPSLYTTQFKQQLPENNAAALFNTIAITDTTSVAMMEVLAKSWLFSNPVVLGDRLSMVHAIELRSPFLDYKLVELAVGLNKAEPKLYQHGIKQLLKDALTDLLPAEVLQRPKQGFRPSVEKWMLGVVQRYGRLLFSGYLARHQIIKPYHLLSLLVITSYRKAAQHVSFMYKLILLEIWCRVYLEGANHEDL